MHGAKCLHVAQKIELLKEDPGERREIAGPAATSPGEGESANQEQHVGATKWLLLPLRHHPQSSKNLSVAHCNHIHPGKGIAGDVIWPSQIDALT